MIDLTFMMHSTDKSAETDAINEKHRKERLEYGVAQQDTWGFDGYMYAILHNGLTMLADNATGWPDRWYETYEEWIAALRNIAFKCKWLYNEGTYSANIFARYSGVPDLSEEFFIWVNQDHDNEPGYQKYEYLSALHEAKRARYHEEVFDWLKKYWGGLWD